MPPVSQSVYRMAVTSQRMHKMKAPRPRMDHGENAWLPGIVNTVAWGLVLVQFVTHFCCCGVH